MHEKFEEVPEQVAPFRQLHALLWANLGIAVVLCKQWPMGVVVRKIETEKRKK